MLRVRVLAKQQTGIQGPMRALIYTAEAVEAGDPHEAALFTCTHEHVTPLDAYLCGLSWIEKVERASPTRSGDRSPLPS
jgi:hypothetical protein